jgi:hypothetical protein
VLRRRRPSDPTVLRAHQLVTGLHATVSQLIGRLKA